MVLNNCNKYYILYKNQDRKKAEFLVGFQRINIYKNKETRIKYMSKAILVLDIPNSCDKCPLCFDSYGQCDLCAATGKLDKCGDMIYEEVIKNGNKPNWCPLKELPDETHNDEYMDEYCDGYDDGWNSLRKKILGEDEEDK